MTTGDEGEAAAPLWKRVGWLLLIWAASVAALGAVAGVIRFVLKP